MKSRVRPAVCGALPEGPQGGGERRLDRHKPRSLGSGGIQRGKLGGQAKTGDGKEGH